MVDSTLYSIFKKGSKTYFYSTLFFPKNVKDDVFRLYSFVRMADNFVDSVPQDREGFYRFRRKYYDAMAGKPANDIVIDSFVELSVRKGFDPAWTDAFLLSMEMDLYKSRYETIDDLNVYLYGSAEVIGLFMAKILDLPKESYEYARVLGRAMQFINFIRDINEDIGLGRVYFPQNELRMFGLREVTLEHARENLDNFRWFVRFQVRRYREWMRLAEKGYAFIPKKSLMPIKTASDMYAFTAWRIYRMPFVVFRKKVKPSVPRIMVRYMRNQVTTKGSKEEAEKDGGRIRPGIPEIDGA